MGGGGSARALAHSGRRTLGSTNGERRARRGSGDSTGKGGKGARLGWLLRSEADSGTAGAAGEKQRGQRGEGGRKERGRGEGSPLHSPCARD